MSTTDLNLMKLEDKVALATTHYTNALIEWNESQEKYTNAIVAVSLARKSSILTLSVEQLQRFEDDLARATAKTQQARKDFETKQRELDNTEKALKKYKESRVD